MAMLSRRLSTSSTNLQRRTQQLSDRRKPKGGGGGGGGNNAYVPPPTPPIPTGTPAVPPTTPPDQPTGAVPVFDYNGMLKNAKTWALAQNSGMPLSGPYEAAQRNAEDTLSSSLNQLQTQWSQLAPANNVFLQRLASQQGVDQASTKEDLVGRGIYDSSITPYTLGQVNAGYDRQRQDQAFQMAGQYGDLSAQTGGVLQDYERSIMDALLQLAADQAANPTQQVSHKHGDTPGYGTGGGNDNGNDGGGGGSNNGGGGGNDSSGGGGGGNQGSGGGNGKGSKNRDKKRRNN